MRIIINIKKEEEKEQIIGVLITQREVNDASWGWSRGLVVLD